MPWGGVEVDLRHLRFAGLQGWDALARAVMQAYIADITANQARRLPCCGRVPTSRCMYLRSSPADNNAGHEVMVVLR